MYLVSTTESGFLRGFFERIAQEALAVTANGRAPVESSAVMDEAAFGLARSSPCVLRVGVGAVGCL